VQVDAPSESDEFTIYEVEADGSYKQVYKKTSDALRHEKKDDKETGIREEQLIVTTLKQVTGDLNIRPAPRIYLDPLREVIPLDEIFSTVGLHPWLPEQAMVP